MAQDRGTRPSNPRDSNPWHGVPGLESGQQCLCTSAWPPQTLLEALTQVLLTPLSSEVPPREAPHAGLGPAWVPSTPTDASHAACSPRARVPERDLDVKSEMCEGQIQGAGPHAHGSQAQPGGQGVQGAGGLPPNRPRLTGQLQGSRPQTLAPSGTNPHPAPSGGG